VSKVYYRTSKKYDGIQCTNHRLTDLLPHVLAKIGKIHDQSGDLVLAMWPDIIGAKLSGMTEAVSFLEGVLVVRVKNSTLHSLLSQYEKMRLLKLLKQKFPHVEFKNISFRIG
jgi:Dna[CI] antecedent DciA-like protein